MCCARVQNHTNNIPYYTTNHILGECSAVMASGVVTTGQLENVSAHVELELTYNIWYIHVHVDSACHIQTYTLLSQLSKFALLANNYSWN